MGCVFCSQPSVSRGGSVSGYVITLCVMLCSALLPKMCFELGEQVRTAEMVQPIGALGKKLSVLQAARCVSSVAVLVEQGLTKQSPTKI